jgi:hypothetical protein
MKISMPLVGSDSSGAGATAYIGAAAATLSTTAARLTGYPTDASLSGGSTSIA